MAGRSFKLRIFVTIMAVCAVAFLIRRAPVRVIVL